MKRAMQNDWRNQVGLNSAWLKQLWSGEEGQDVAEYSIMLAVVLVIVVGTVRLIGSNAGNIFSQVGSSIQ
jgi:Flp pilus assembly pilin Flp